MGSLSSMYDCAETMKVRVYYLIKNKQTNNNKTKKKPEQTNKTPHFAHLIMPVARLPTQAMYLVYFELYSAGSTES